MLELCIAISHVPLGMHYYYKIMFHALIDLEWYLHDCYFERQKMKYFSFPTSNLYVYRETCSKSAWCIKAEKLNVPQFSFLIFLWSFSSTVWVKWQVTAK